MHMSVGKTTCSSASNFVSPWYKPDLLNEYSVLFNFIISQSIHGTSISWAQNNSTTLFHLMLMQVGMTFWILISLHHLQVVVIL